MKLLKLLRKLEKREHVIALIEIFSTGTIALYFYANRNTLDRKYIRDFNSFIELEKWLEGQEVPDPSLEVRNVN